MNKLTYLYNDQSNNILLWLGFRLRTLLHGSCFQVLGNGFEVISVGKKKLVRSVPTELNKDHNEILDLAQVCPIFFLLLFYIS